MRFTITRSKLLPALEAACQVADKKTPIPAHACVMLDASGDAVTVRAANYVETVALSGIPASVDAPGAFLVAADDLRKRVGAFREGEIHIGIEGDTMRLRQGPMRFSLAVLPRDEAPVFPKVEAVGGVSVGAPELEALLGRLVVAAGDDETRAHMYGVAVEMVSGRLRAKATDGHLCATASIQVRGEVKETIIPLPAVAHIRKLLGGADGDVQFGAAGSLLWVALGSTLYTTRLPADERFPPIDQVIPALGGAPTSVDRAALADELKRLSVVVYGKQESEPIAYLRVRGGSLGVRCKHVPGADGWTSIDVDGGAFKGGAFNLGYLRTAIDFFGGERVEFRTEGNDPWDTLDPLLVTDGAGGDGRFVVMPIRSDRGDFGDL